MTEFRLLRWLAVLFLSLLWATVGSAAAVAERGGFGQCSLAARTPATIVTQGHHPIPKFLGGNQKQVLSPLERGVHTEFHSLLRSNLKDAGIPLNVGGRGGSAADWARYFNANPGSQRTALDAVLDSSRAIDYKYGTQVTRDVWQNVLDGSFQVFP